MWWRRRRSDEDFADEIRSHLESEADRLVGEGLTAADARAAAHREFGNVARARERFYEASRVVWLEHFTRDLRYAWRGLWRSRTFVASTVLTLAVGMGLVTVVFAIFNAYVLRPFAVHDPYSLYALRWQAQEASGSTFRWTDYEQVRARRDLFEGVIAEAVRPAASDVRQLSIGFVSGDYFDTLKARVHLGRGLMADDAGTPGGEPVVVLTHQAWTRLFDGDPAVLGRLLTVNGQKLTIVGVMAPEFTGLDDVPRDVWVPLTMYGAVMGEDLFGGKQPRQLKVVTRLRSSVTPQQAQGGLLLEPFETRVTGRVDAVRASLQLQATPTRMTLSQLALLSPVFAAFALVLIAACANASNVMLARANSRHREIGVRLSIGASRSRIVRQLMTEGLLIAVLAGLAGLALAAILRRVGMYLFVVLLPPTVASRVRFLPFDFDYRVFLFASLVAAAATILFALLPALQATRVSLTDALRNQPSSGIKRSTLRSFLITAQVTVSLILLIVAATLVRNGTAIRATDLGIDTGGVISIRPRESEKGLVLRTHSELTADPRIQQVVVASRNPLFGETMRIPLWQPSGLVLSSCTFVSPGYFEMLRIPLVQGRGFSSDEAQIQAPVAIVSVAGARTLWPGEDPIGKTLRLTIPEPANRLQVADTVRELRRVDPNGADAIVVTVIGVAQDVVSGFVYEGRDAAHVYLPTSPTGARAKALMARTRPGVGHDTLRAILQRAHHDRLAFDVLSLDEIVTLQMFPLRAASWIGSLLSVLALVFSIAGLYGVLVYTFGQRTQEIGIRIALGATASAIVRLVLVQSARLAVLGTALGLVLGFSVMKILSRFIRLDNVSVVDPGAFAVAIGLIAFAVALASYGPAKRATRVDPSSMLRIDT